MSGGSKQTLTVGRYEPLSPSEPCDGCPEGVREVFGSPPPDWCRLTFEAKAGVRVDIAVTIAPGAPCRIEVVRLTMITD